MLTSMPSPFTEAVKCPSFTLNFLEGVECANRPFAFSQTSQCEHNLCTDALKISRV